MSETSQAVPPTQSTPQPSVEKTTPSMSSPPQEDVSKIELQIANQQAQINLIKNRLRLEIIALLTMIVIEVPLVIFTKQRLSDQNAFWTPADVFITLASLAASVVLPLIAIFLIYESVKLEIKKETLKTDIGILEVKLRIANQFTKISPRTLEQTSASYFETLVRINIDNLGAYYALVKNHTQKSFIASITAGTIGFVLIVIGIISGFFNAPHAQIIPYIASASGVITEFIAGVFFYLYNRTVLQMKEYHDSLLTVQNILLAFKIIGDAPDESEKIKMISQMLAYLMSKRDTLIATDTDTSSSGLK